MSEPRTEPDAVDAVIEAWTRERPDLDLGAIAVAGRLGRVGLLPAPAQEKVFTEFGLQKGEFDVLASLRRSGDPYTLRPSQLSETLMLTRAGMTNRLDRLEAAGLVERTIDPADRRSFRVRLTEKGYATVEDAMTAHTANVTRLLSALSEDQLGSPDGLLRVLLRALSHQ